MKAKNFLFLIMFLFAQSLYASLAPSKCPDTFSILLIGFDQFEKDAQSRWIVKKARHHYFTPEEWTFAMLPFDVQTELEAAQLAKKALKKIVSSAGPEEVAEGEWMCTYYSADGYTGMAHTPAL